MNMVQHSSPTVRSAIPNGPEEHSAMMRAPLERKRCRVNGKGVTALKPFGRILKRNRSAAVSRMEPPHEMGLSLPVNMDFEAHGRES